MTEQTQSQNPPKDTVVKLRVVTDMKEEFGKIVVSFSQIELPPGTRVVQTDEFTFLRGGFTR